jgi:thiosulfate reductase cytochrome b subunit
MAAEYDYPRHALTVRVAHWINAIALALLLMSGLQIFNAHPSLYWGQSSYSGNAPWLELADGFPSWATIPGEQWLALGRRWHFFFAWILVLNGAAYLVYSIWSRHITRDLTPTRSDWRSIRQSIVDHLRLRRPQGEVATRYNVLQKFSYLVVIFLLLPLMILTGWSMSPWLNSVWPGWVDLLGGRQSARTLHFIGAWVLVAFVTVHVFEVIATGLWNNLRSMITGRYHIQIESTHERR